MSESDIISLVFLIYFVWSLGGIIATMLLHFKYNQLPEDAGAIGLFYLLSILIGWLCWLDVYRVWRKGKRVIND